MKTLILTPRRLTGVLSSRAKAVFQRLWLAFFVGATTLPAAEVSNYALKFDGVDDRVQASTNLFPAIFNDFTIELWVNPTGFRAPTTETNSGISDVNQRFAVFPDHGDLSYGPTHAAVGLSIGTNGISVFEHAVNHLPSVLVYPANLSGWTHVALVYVDRTPLLYVNGTLARVELTSEKAFVHPSANLGGSINAPGLGPYQGQLDEVRIWSAPLSHGQIQANMNHSLAGDEPNLVVYFRCDAGTGLALADHAPNDPAVNGVLVNGTSWVPSGAPPLQPLAQTLPATATGPNINTANGRFNPAGNNTSAWFEWGATTNYENHTPVRSLGSGTSNSNLSEVLPGVTVGITYHFRAVASNAVGVVFGTNQTFIAPFFTELGAGYLTKLRFDNIGNSVNVTGLLNHPKYLNDQPDFTSLRTEFSANDSDECDNCGYVVRGLFIPAATGPHIFYLAADDGGVLFLSTNESRANKVQIAREPFWAHRRDYLGRGEGGGRGDPPANRSEPIHLIAGARYYIEGAVKEATGGDNLDVAVQGPGDALVADGDRPIFGNRIGTTVDLPGVSDGSVAWGDFDNDGDLDILLTGQDTDLIAIARVYRNNGNGRFTDLNADLLGVRSSSVAWGDFNNDGHLDILLAGDPSVPNLLYRALVYRNNSDGTFTNINAEVLGVARGSAAWGDFDNDGNLDILLTGDSDRLSGPLPVPISRVYRNNGNDTFTELIADLPGVHDSSAAWGDFNNDGHLDILLTGRTASGDGTSLVCRNNGNSTFTRFNFSSFDFTGFLFGVGEGSAAWGDSDNDGHLDILVTGYSPPRGPIARVYRNNGNSIFADFADFADLKASLPGVTNSSAVWGDYDNDGHLDILLTGYAPGFGTIARVYRNNGNSTFTDLNAGLPGVSGGSAAWGDYDNDGDLDILLTGLADFGPIARVYRNNTPQANTPPHAPTGLTVALNQGTATLSWNAATDGQTPSPGLTYNVRVGTTPGASDVMGPMASAGGVRRLPQMGNAQQRLTALLRYNDNTPYYWSVQAVDGAFAGSAFAEANFRIHRIEKSVISPATVISIPVGDLNGDGLVDQNELNTVLSNYLPNSPFLQMTNTAGLGGTNVTFALTNSLAAAFSVEYTTNLFDWLFLGPATPRYEFTDTNAPAVPQRYYRLRWP